jgi:catechol 2,3-dioxygenase-like lactoylglutathione lyase family enzyme
MFDHATIHASNREASEGFYETVLQTLGIEKEFTDEHYAEWNDFSLAQAAEDKPVTRRLHIAFIAPTTRHVDEFWRVGTEAFPASDNKTVEEFHRAATEAGYRDNGAPGERAIYHPGYYGAFVLDPDGNNVEVVNHDRG